MRDIDFKVCVVCNTYNQAKYIEDAMDGFCMQVCSFPFVCCITDDASTDGEQSVIQDYLLNHFSFDDGIAIWSRETDCGHLYFARHNDNKSCYFVVIFLKENHYRKGIDKKVYISEWLDIAPYTAFCEGDDYWIDAKKLQKQVDWLDAHKDYSMCFSNAKVRKEGIYSSAYIEGIIENREYGANEILQNWCVPTASVVIRNQVLNVPVIKPERILFGDIIIFLKAERYGRVWGFSDTMTVYRINCGGVTQNPKYTRMSIMKRPGHIEFIIDNFGDLLDMNWLKSELCMRYCNRSLARETMSDRMYDLYKAFSIRMLQALCFVCQTYLVERIKNYIR